MELIKNHNTASNINNLIPDGQLCDLGIKTNQFLLH